MFSQLEESNIFLMQTAQEAQESGETIIANLSARLNLLASEAAFLEHHIEGVKAVLYKQRGHCKALQVMIRHDLY
jgi:hypothetical protein